MLRRVAGRGNRPDRAIPEVQGLPRAHRIVTVRVSPITRQEQPQVAAGDGFAGAGYEVGMDVRL
jgi:hypothetical protein